MSMIILCDRCHNPIYWRSVSQIGEDKTILISSCNYCEIDANERRETAFIKRVKDVRKETEERVRKEMQEERQKEIQKSAIGTFHF